MTVHEMRNHPAFDVLSVKSDLDKIKTGMAETGSSISKLENTHETMEKQVKILSQRSAKFHMILLNVTVRFILFFFYFSSFKNLQNPQKGFINIDSLDSQSIVHDSPFLGVWIKKRFYTFLSRISSKGLL